MGKESMNEAACSYGSMGTVGGVGLGHQELKLL